MTPLPGSDAPVHKLASSRRAHPQLVWIKKRERKKKRQSRFSCYYLLFIVHNKHCDILGNRGYESSRSTGHYRNTRCCGGDTEGGTECRSLSHDLVRQGKAKSGFPGLESRIIDNGTHTHTCNHTKQTIPQGIMYRCTRRNVTKDTVIFHFLLAIHPNCIQAAKPWEMLLWLCLCRSNAILNEIYVLWLLFS